MCSNPAESQRVVSFCTGYGGLERGLELAGVDIQPLAYVEREAYAAANLASKIEKGKMAAAPIFSDVTTFPSKYFSEKLGRPVYYALRQVVERFQLEYVPCIVFQDGKYMKVSEVNIDAE